jgi:hypothetical protein
MISLDVHPENHAVPIPLQQATLSTAKRFAEEQPDPVKAHQVYLNTLAVCAVQTYFGLLGIDTDAPRSDSWHQSLRLANNAADLMLPERGVIECLPISPDAEIALVSEEVQIRRIAYLVVEVVEPFHEAMLLGFMKSPGWLQSPINRNGLTSPDELPIYLAQFHHTSLKDWCSKDIESIWQPPDQVLAIPYPAFRFRTQAGPILKQARTLQLTSAEGTLVHLGLLLSTRGNSDSMDVSVQLHSAKGDFPSLDATPSLQPGITLELLSDEGEVLQSVVARHNPLDTFIQLIPFQCLPEDYYQLRITVEGDQHIELLTCYPD